MKRFFFPGVFFVILLAIPCFGQDAAYQHSCKAGDMTFQWSLGSDSIQIKVSAKTTGWVGIGFNPTKEMKDANFIIGYVKDGQVQIKDQFGSGENTHAEDKKLGGTDNVTNVSGDETNGITGIAFTIPLNSGDKYDEAIKPDQETTVLLAYGAGMDSFLTKHQFRTSLKVNLTTGSFKEIK